MRAFALISWLTLAALAWSTPAEAQQEHTVRSGQSLSRIARRYRVRVQDLAAANGLTVRSELQEGQTLRIPERGTHYVRSGQTLSHVAAEHSVSVADLARVNRIRRDATLQVGQRLLLPGHDPVEEREEAESRWGRPRHPGVVTLVRVLTHERIRMRLVDSRGRARRAAKRRLARLFRYRQTTQSKEPSGRLLQVLTRVSDHFGGRPISVYSAYRPEGGSTNESSRHVAGAAVDIRIRGVSNQQLRDYLRTLPRVGVGYYPNGRFVHVDVRSRSAYWVDRSGVGEDPDYVPRGEREDVE
ncbi:MAG: LysM peptidoglycan-binding domain-containing protein [Deltaproteobacteria bacterium]|nr:LysM peptidoglycan-binding domain-containing protein [Deltaproteobacteria bacterium]